MICGWHAGGRVIITCIAIETCEPAGIEYAEDSFDLIACDSTVFAKYFEKVWQDDIQLSLWLCQQFQIAPGNIISHHEGFWLVLQLAAMI